jgi:SAM-dependent methyltransferase
MAPSLLWRKLGRTLKPLRVLDPMSGSGTTAVVSRLRGHRAIGFDSDPLALLIARVWSSDVDPARVRRLAVRLVQGATKRSNALPLRDSYPRRVDEETRAFLRYWFDASNRRQLAALALQIQGVRNISERTLLWCAFSRLIITKQSGASLAMDVSHSRPHKVYETAPIKPLKHFLKAVEGVLRGTPFGGCSNGPKARIQKGDARALPLRTGSIDLVITSPPYLNAIDYLRGHKLSLVWMGYRLRELRELRAGNIGTELVSMELIERHEYVRKAMVRMGQTEGLPNRVRGMLARYVFDMDQVMSEISRVLKRKGEAILVVGDSTIRGVFVRNSWALAYLGRRHGLELESTRRRPLQENRRYLPPPQCKTSGTQFRSRMREEVILAFKKN